MIEFPKMLYRPGPSFEWEGKSFDLLTVHNEEEEATARSEGWGAHDEGQKPIRRRK